VSESIDTPKLGTFQFSFYLDPNTFRFSSGNDPTSKPLKSWRGDWAWDSLGPLSVRSAGGGLRAEGNRSAVGHAVLVVRRLGRAGSRVGSVDPPKGSVGGGAGRLRASGGGTQ